MIYYNPDDPALFAPKRFGAGYSLNFGNRWSWVFVAGVVLIVGNCGINRARRALRVEPMAALRQE